MAPEMRRFHRTQNLNLVTSTISQFCGRDKIIKTFEKKFPLIYLEMYHVCFLVLQQLNMLR